MPEPKTTDLNRALARVSNPPKGKKPHKPRKLPQKKRTSAKHNKTRKVEETTNLAHITKAIVREGGTVADVGIILGCAAYTFGGEAWLVELKAKGLSVAEFLEVAKTRADIDLIRVAVKAATGYEYEEESQEFIAVPEIGDDGTPTGKALTHYPGKKTIKKRHQSADTTLLKFLLSSRMPEFFMERKEIKIDKRVVEIKADAEAEIRSFASGLLKSLGENVIEAEFVNTVEAVG